MRLTIYSIFATLFFNTFTNENTIQQVTSTNWHYDIDLTLNHKDLNNNHFLTTYLSYSPIIIQKRTYASFEQEFSNLLNNANNPNKESYYNWPLFILEYRAFNQDQEALNYLVTAANAKEKVLPLTKILPWALGFNGIADSHIKENAETIAENLIGLLQTKKLPLHFSYLEYLFDLHDYQQNHSPGTEPKILLLLNRWIDQCRQAHKVHDEELLRFVRYIKLANNLDEYHLGRINFNKRKFKTAANFWLLYAMNGGIHAGSIIARKIRTMINNKQLPTEYADYLEDTIFNLNGPKKRVIKGIHYTN